MVLLCNNNLLDLKKDHKLSCNKKKEIINKITIDNHKKFKIEDHNNTLYIKNNNNDTLIKKIQQSKN